MALSGTGISESDDVSAISRLLSDPDARLWIDLTDPPPEVVATVGEYIGLHPLIAEDIIESNERAKIELVDDVIHVVMFVLGRGATVEAWETDFVLGHRFLLSVHPQAWDPRSVHQLKLGPAAVMAKGLDFLLWALLDGIVDGYFPVFDGYADEVDDIQDVIIEDPSKDALQQVFRVKRDLVKLRHVVYPSREIFSRLTSREFELVGDAQVFYFRDVYDHLIRLTDEFDTLRDLVAGALEVYLSTVNNNLSTIMKRLTGVTVILAGIGAVGGLFGMSQATPALAGGEGLGFWAITLGTLVLAAIVAAFLRRIDWI